MKVILTHDNADFDAIASLLGMHKLDPEAIPILPDRLNANVSQFLLLYAPTLPAMRREDIPPRTVIDMAYVVDSLSFNSVKGMNPKTPIHFLDHHTLDRPLLPHQQHEGETLGANTTLLVERLQARTIPITSPEATLLLLGIYEDTGSLSYRGTTPRDMRAAAWLLEQQADLDIVLRFLHHPLNDIQRSLFNLLEESAVSVQIHGHRLVVTSAVIADHVDEMAALAHKLRDLFDCDALFMVVQVAENVQIIARSTVDNIDVGAIIRQFGGGGHERAAAVLVRDEILGTVLPRFLKILRDQVMPAVRVEALMSWGVQSIQANATIGEAHAAMLETGHEGYPVLDKNELIGLLTRRAVDRAIRHNMQHDPIIDIMEANPQAVQPTDSIETLKDKMLATGWGQMPVVNAQNELIGIVTRTDLINRWSHDTAIQHPRREILERLQTALPPLLWKLLEAISAAASEQRNGLYLVGGIVRDLLLNRPNTDIDLVVEGDGIALARSLQKEFGGIIHKHEQFGTAKWKLDAGVAEKLGFPGDEFPPTIDFATSRAEFYEAPTVLPTVRRSSIKLDLHRRDFTINTLAIRLAPAPMGDLLDFYKGEQDLRDGIIRALHSLSFVDDPTRILRAVRFEQRFGFAIEPRTMQRLKAALPLMERVSGDRIRHELNLILAEAYPLKDLERLHHLDILSAIHPALQLTENTLTDYAKFESLRQSPPWQIPPDYDDWRILAFSLLTCRRTADEIDAICQRLLTARRTVDQLQAVRRGYELLPELLTLKISEVVEKLEPLGQTAWLALWILGDESARSRLAKFVQEWQYIKPVLDGNDLRGMGLKPSPVTGQILRALRIGRLDGQLKDAADERAYAQQLIEAPSNHP